ncbi:hypothetical protein BLNAU_2152 [Blattamonas nauphoetae]|uniref:C3H1-type domain-containing protein n=1 Tax=Blattamonas nauphoetae TaxID=2049346 RepID=A0ABQ9YGK8_9EUKA|nr:hypothetical protein BLNAU_2152 [Blattamonas nauphoetae]
METVHRDHPTLMFQPISHLFSPPGSWNEDYLTHPNTIESRSTSPESQENEEFPMNPSISNETDTDIHYFEKNPSKSSISQNYLGHGCPSFNIDSNLSDGFPDPPSQSLGVKHHDHAWLNHANSTSTLTPSLGPNHQPYFGDVSLNKIPLDHGWGDVRGSPFDEIDKDDVETLNVDLEPLQKLISLIAITLYPRVFISLDTLLRKRGSEELNEDERFCSLLLSHGRESKGEINSIPSYILSVKQLRLPVPQEQLFKWFRCKTRLCHHVEHGTHCSHYPACWFTHYECESLDNILLPTPTERVVTSRLKAFSGLNAGDKN